MSEALKEIEVITLFVEDVTATKTFYLDVFDVKVIYQDEESAVLKFENLMVNLLHVGEAPGLIEPAPVGGSQAGSRFQLTINVKDADAVCAELGKRGVRLLNGPIDRPWGRRTAAFADPAGHLWEIAQELPPQG
ncbi:MAG TPA: VOC family protein [Jatrophihabitans sp.]|nr:VOC family protein [Jatrophihabitans sp.]